MQGRELDKLAMQRIQELEAQLAEAKRDPYKGEWKRKYFMAKERIDELTTLLASREAEIDWLRGDDCD